MAPAADSYQVLGVARNADGPAIHTAYRRAVRRTHPDVGGSAAEFEAVQSAYETLRDPARRAAHDRASAPPPSPPPRRAPPPASESGVAHQAMDDLLAESRRLENEARRLSGLPPRDFGEGAAEAAAEGEGSDSFTAILDDAQRQLRDAAAAVAREVRRRARRVL